MMQLRFLALSLALCCSTADAADAACKFNVTTQSGRRVAVADAALNRQNGAMQFRLSRAAAGGVLEVRFKPLGKASRLKPSEILEQLNDGGEARGGFHQGNHEESLRRPSPWEYSSGIYSASFQVSPTVLALFGSGFFHFDLTNLSEGQANIDPGSYVDTSQCANVMRSL